MRQSVSAIFRCEQECFVIKRQNYLKAFPGYQSFPGGKVDQEDKDVSETDFLMVALAREIKEELGVDLPSLQKEGVVQNIKEIGVAITPDFNPHRFANHYFLIECASKPDFQVDSAEAEYSSWLKPQAWLTHFKSGEYLAVPPMLMIMRTLEQGSSFSEALDFSLPYDGELEVPTIEPVGGVFQFLPLSKTFPPANRTNSFLIGDVLVDPSPKDDAELVKLEYSLRNKAINSIFITHHHPDHHERSTDLARKLTVPMGMSKKTEQLLSEKYGDEYLSGIQVNYFKDGDILTQSNEQDVVVYEVPGHDEGQLALAPKSMNWFLVGDLIQTVGTVLVGGPEGDMGKYFNSLRRVIDLSPKVVIPSHGIAIGGVHKLEQTLEHRQMRESTIEQLLGRGKDVREILMDIYGEIDERLWPYAELTIKAHIDHIKQRNS